MKVLFVSRFALPNPTGSNKNVFLQAKSLREDFGVDVEILSWELNGPWAMGRPERNGQRPLLKSRKQGLTYHVFNGDLEWNEVAGGNAISECAWEAAVKFGMHLLTFLKPDIVHLQHRHGLWWLLDSAQRLGILTFYSNHDWGIACMRTTLVMGDNALCDGRVYPDKCARCIFQGRGLVGKVNERLVQMNVGRQFMKLLERTPLEKALRLRGAVRFPAEQRVRLNYARATRVLSNLNHLFTPSQFGRRFFIQLGIQGERVSILPWYHDPSVVEKTLEADHPFTISYIGRVSPEKGVHMIFKSLCEVRGIDSVVLRIAGANDSQYCKKLKKTYPEAVGNHRVEWLGWADVGPLFNSSDVTIIPSLWMDNTPLSLIESLAYRVPVIATRIPPIEELVKEGENAFLSEYMSVGSLADAIRRAAKLKEVIRSGTLEFPKVMTLKEYVASVVEKYESVYRTGGL